jgi:hypothetical protein
MFHNLPLETAYKKITMKKTIAALLLILLILASCSKDATTTTTDYSSGWVGTYTNSNAPSAGLNHIVISRTGTNTLQVLLQLDTASYIGTVATLTNVAVVNATTIALNENGTLAGITDSTFQFVASGALSGNTLILSGSATNTATPIDVKNFYFTGSK